MGQRLREAITHGMPQRNPSAFPSQIYALREIDGFTAVPSEAMLFTLNMFFILNMKIGGKCYALFPFHLEAVLRGGSGIVKTGDAFEPYHISGVLQGVGGDAQ